MKALAGPAMLLVIVGGFTIYKATSKDAVPSRDFTELELTRCRCDLHAQWRLALKYDLSAYDAAYLWLAAELGALLATFDERLGGAARALLGSS